MWVWVGVGVGVHVVCHCGYTHTCNIIHVHCIVYKKECMYNVHIHVHCRYMYHKGVNFQGFKISCTGLWTACTHILYMLRGYFSRNCNIPQKQLKFVIPVPL